MKGLIEYVPAQKRLLPKCVRCKRVSVLTVCRRCNPDQLPELAERYREGGMYCYAETAPLRIVVDPERYDGERRAALKRFLLAAQPKRVPVVLSVGAREHVLGPKHATPYVEHNEVWPELLGDALLRLERVRP